MDILQDEGNGLVWFRRDLRLDDNPALTAAVRSGRPLICAFILDERPGGASAWWLQRSLDALKTSLSQRGAGLTLCTGATEDVLLDLVRKYEIGSVFANLTGLPDLDRRDRELAGKLDTLGVQFRAFQSATLVRPDSVRTKTGGVFKVFTPFWRSLTANAAIRDCLPPPETIRAAANLPESLPLSDLALYEATPDWAAAFPESWTPGENGGLAQLDRFRADGLDDYGDKRDRPDLEKTSRLSPHLAWGEVSPRRVWHAVRDVSDSRDAGKFLSEVGWREFSYYLLHHFPHIETQSFRPDFDRFAWRDDEAGFQAWCRGETGYPLVDAGMRQLWQTGWMHNRVRMVAASFLVKHLLIDWRRGLDWFADTLVDHDRASNAASWQWVAGSGADAAPYFRIFNPIAQGEKFDPDGTYIRHWCPELAGLSSRDIHAPFKARGLALASAGVTLGGNYPGPIVEHSYARQRALDTYSLLKQSAEPA